jgi:hypothetical protein
MRTELAALRSVPAFRRALAVAIALAGVLTINFLGLKDLALTTAEDARSALSAGAIAGFVAVAYAAGSAGGELARGGLALALLGGQASRREAVRARVLAYAAAGALLGVGGAAMACALTFLLLATGGAHLPGADQAVARAAGTIVYAALMGALGAGVGLALRSAPAAVTTTMVVLLAVDPFAAGISTPIAHWGIGGVSGALTGSGASDLPPAWAAGLTLLAYAALLAALAGALTARRDVP